MDLVLTYKHTEVNFQLASYFDFLNTASGDVIFHGHRYLEIKDKLKDIVISVANGKDSYVLLPTGYSNSF